MNVNRLTANWIVSDVYYNILKTQVGKKTETGTYMTRKMRDTIEERFKQVASYDIIEKHKWREEWVSKNKK